ncbi:hypothetical protein [Paenibacillus sp. SN-8-1]|uniref:hypothetical protein n=1 Tax=Paenibacillus sp. SN-8-1 TaxID=3435409 RepID=UPI003D9A6841
MGLVRSGNRETTAIVRMIRQRSGLTYALAVLKRYIGHYVSQVTYSVGWLSAELSGEGGIVLKKRSARLCLQISTLWG